MAGSQDRYRFDSPDEALTALLQSLAPVSVEEIAWRDAAGRVLAQALLTDRDSPPCNVSAMDGYAVRLDDLSQATLPVRHSPRIGQAPPELDPGCAMRIVTGGAAPAGAEAIVPRELVEEHEDRIILRIAPGEVSRGQHIRRQGENGRAGVGVLPGGTLIHAPSLAALASFGVARLTVYRKVRVGVIVTGDELLDVESRPAPWQIRDSNGPALDTLLSACPWVESRAPVRVADEEEVLRGRLREALRDCDVVVLTGGVSMGQRDYVPGVVAALGARVMFHKLPIRPGKPILAAVGPDGQAILGLPGNPVSAMVGACRFLAPVCRKRGGFLQPMARPAQVQVVNPDQAALKLWWWRLVKSCGVGQVQLVENRGSGDIIAAARSDGFVEIPPGQCGPGPWAFFRWEI